MSEPTVEQMKAWLRSLPGSMSAWSKRDEAMREAIRRLIEQSKPIPREFVERWVGQIIFLPLNAMENWSACLPEQLRDMFTELGHEVEVEEKEGGDERF